MGRVGEWDSERFMTRCLRYVQKERPGIDDGMEWVIGEVTKSADGLWAHAASADWGAAGLAYVEWFRALLEAEPLPTEAEALWFETPNDLSPAASIVNAFEKLGPAQMSYGLDEGAMWPCEHDGIVDLPTLETVIRGSGWRERDAELREKLEPGVWALSASFVALVAMEAVVAADVLGKVRHRSGVAVLTGFAAGDAVPILQLRPSGWGAVRRVKMRSKEAWQEIMWYPGLDIAGYLRAGCDADARKEDAHGKTLLMDHALFLTPRDVDLLVEAGADVSARDEYGMSVLHYCSGSATETVERLIEHGADVNATTDYGHSVLHAAVWDNPKLVRLLLESGADATAMRRHPHDFSVLDEAVQHAVDPEIIRMLVDAGARFVWAMEEGNTPLHHLARVGIFRSEQRPRVPGLIGLYKELGYDINHSNSDGDSPLWIALRKHGEELQSHLASVQEFGYLGGTWDYNYDWMAIELLNHGADPNARCGSVETPFVPEGGTPLMVQRYDDAKLVKALLAHGADPSLHDAAGMTALDHARAAMEDGVRFGRGGCAEVVKLLSAR